MNKKKHAASSHEGSRSSTTSPDSMKMKETHRNTKTVSISTHSEHSSSSSSDEVDDETKTPQSYREKLKQRFKSIKQKSLDKVEGTGFKKTAASIMSMQKCIENLRQENENIDLQLKQRKRRDFIESKDISSTLKYQFFCENIKTGDDTELSQSGIHGQTNDFEIVNIRGESMLEELRSQYEEFTWKPNSDKLDKLDFEDSGRNLSEEGIYVGVPANIPAKHRFLLKQRLRASGDMMWFDSSNEVVFDESNCARKSYRPDGCAAENTSCDTFYVKASLSLPEPLSSVMVHREKPQLTLNILRIRFTSHPLFSDEHCAQEELLSLVDEHKALVAQNKRDKLFERLQTLRRIKHDQCSGDHITSNAILKQIKSVRDEFYRECKLYRNNAKSILAAWKTLKELREKNAFSTTSIRLLINKSKANVDDYEEALQELFAEKEAEYQTKLLKYKNELAEWRQRSTDEIRSEEEMEEMDKPRKPPRVESKKDVKRKLASEFENSFGSKDEPWLSFTVAHTNEITKTSALEGDTNNAEKRRRTFVRDSKMFVRISCNDITINKSRPVKLNDIFTLEFQTCLDIQLEEPLPGEIQVVLCEQTHFKTRLLHTFHLHIPQRTQNTRRTSAEEMFFEIEDERKAEMKISGILTFSMEWKTSGTCVPNETGSLMNADGTLNTENIADWIAENQPDPLDPRNAIIFDYDRGLQDRATTMRQGGSQKYFRCDPYLETLTIASKQDLEKNIRFQVLQLRDQKVPEFVGLSVPIRLQEIPANIFSTYNRRLNEETYSEYFDEVDGLNDDVRRKRSLGRRYLQQIHTKVYQMCVNAKNNIRYEDVVNEKMVSVFQLVIQTLLGNFLNWFKWTPRRSIPMPTVEDVSHERNAMDELRNSAIFRYSPLVLSVKIKCAHNLPVRLKEEVEPHSASKFTVKSTRKRRGGDESEIKRPEYLVEISYKEKCVSTSLTTELCNETLQMKIDHMDFSKPASPDGLIKLNLFEQMSDSTIWIGSVEIPISATIGDVKLEGRFPLNIPLHIFGYKKETDTASVGVTSPRTQQVNNKLLSTLEMEVHMETTFPGLYVDTNTMPSNEPPYLRDHISNFNRRFNENHPKRSFNALAITSNGKTSCLTRFIKPLEPPHLNPDGFDISVEQCAKYVSLIPFSNATKFYENIWLTSEQMLKLGTGTISDHAVLLTCYLLSLNLDVWLLIGFGIPHGHSSYVLQQEYVNETTIPHHYIIDVVRGIKFNVTEPNCPLQKIYCVINDCNIWANKQRGDSVATTRFDLTRRFDWQALFNKQVPSPDNSIQQKLHYLRNGDAKTLQNVIEKKLRRKIAKLRSHDVTIWNHHISRVLHTLVDKFEKQFAHNKTQTSDIEQLSQNCKISGFVHCIPFVSIKQVIEDVVRTKIHSSSTSNVEFASAVRIQTYTNQVLAVFIGLVTIQTR